MATRSSWTLILVSLALALGGAEQQALAAKGKGKGKENKSSVVRRRGGKVERDKQRKPSGQQSRHRKRSRRDAFGKRGRRPVALAWDSAAARTPRLRRTVNWLETAQNFVARNKLPAHIRYTVDDYGGDPSYDQGIIILVRDAVDVAEVTGFIKTQSGQLPQVDRSGEYKVWIPDPESALDGGIHVHVVAIDATEFDRVPMNPLVPQPIPGVTFRNWR